MKLLLGILGIDIESSVELIMIFSITIGLYLYFSVLILLLWQAFRVMSKGLLSIDKIPRKKDKDSTDRTGLLTVHPELLTQEGQITDEDLLTVRFSNDLDPPKSSNEEVL